MRVLADVNVLVSSAIAPLGASRAIVSAWRANQLELATAEGIIAEVETKLRSTRIRARYRLSESHIRSAIDILRTQAEIVWVPSHTVVHVTGDPEDDYVLAAAALAHVEYMVTGDKALQALGSHGGVPIVSPAAFLRGFQPPAP
jgi:putative PIN family toxin of toxin-antitoxin system